MAKNAKVSTLKVICTQVQLFEQAVKYVTPPQHFYESLWEHQISIRVCRKTYYESLWERQISMRVCEMSIICTQAQLFFFFLFEQAVKCYAATTLL